MIKACPIYVTHVVSGSTRTVLRYQPPSIMHEDHEHTLHLRTNCEIEGCVACHQQKKTFSYGCGNCNFHLHSNCTMLPHTIKHRGAIGALTHRLQYHLPDYIRQHQVVAP
ncbi:hypothetical protein ACSBR2_041652 [Camellia fascicularis]